MNKTIIVMEGATEEELIRFKEDIENCKDKLLLTNANTTVFQVTEEGLFEVVSSLKKVIK